MPLTRWSFPGKDCSRKRPRIIEQMSGGPAHATAEKDEENALNSYKHRKGGEAQE